MFSGAQFQVRDDSRLTISCKIDYQFQVQSMGKWVRYLGSWEGDPEPRRRLAQVTAEL
jgi:hypothetical protein